MSRLFVDISEIWLVALTFMFACVFFGAASPIKGTEEMIGGCFVPLLLLIADVVLTVLLFTGHLALW